MHLRPFLWVFFCVFKMSQDLRITQLQYVVQHTNLWTPLTPLDLGGAFMSTISLGQCTDLALSANV